MKPTPFVYNATVERVVDGDTVDVTIDLGFLVKMHGQRLRLHGINAPETRGETKDAGLVSKAALASMLPVGGSIIVQTIKDADEKFGRLLARIYLGDLCVNDTMVRNGFAVPYDGGKR